MTVFSGKAASMKPAPRGTEPRSKMVRVKVLESERERIENLADLASRPRSPRHRDPRSAPRGPQARMRAPETDRGP